MKISGLPTPALVLDVNILKKNAEAMRNLLEGSSLQLRPHYKSHKCADIALWQMENGAVGMTCAKLSEAEDLCDAGVKTYGVDQGMPAVREGTMADIVASEEHFQLHGYAEEKQVGDKLLLIPGHCCSTVNLHHKIYLVDGDRVIRRIPVTARGIGK